MQEIPNLKILCLTRRPGETIVVSGIFGTVEFMIEVKVREIRGQQVKIDVKAPTEIKVNRGEIQKKIDAGIPHKKNKENKS